MKLNPETEEIEYKKSTGEIKEAMISIASMLNKHGRGVLFFGVRNDGECVGQQIGDSTLRDVSKAIATAIKPQIVPTISLELIEEKNIIKVEVEGKEKPYSAYGKYYIRSADEDRELAPQQLKNIMVQTANEDVMTELASERQDLTFNQLKILFSIKGMTLNEDSFEENLGLRNKDNEYNLLAYLLADENDISIKTVVFRGTDKSEMVSRNEYGYKCLVLAMDQVLSYMEAINDTSVTLGNHQRSETKLFDFAAFKEAWQNACLHTKWERLNPPAVYIFSDRIEIISTGGLPSDLSKSEFFKGISRPINTKLQKIFGQLGYVEQTGHGVPLIVSRYGEKAFDIMDNYINVVIPFRQEKKQINVTSDMQDAADINENTAEDKIYKFFKSHPDATISDIAREVRYSDSYVRKVIKTLKDKGKIERVGSNKSGYWKVLEVSPV